METEKRMGELAQENIQTQLAQTIGRFVQRTPYLVFNQGVIKTICQLSDIKKLISSVKSKKEASILCAELIKSIRAIFPKLKDKNIPPDLESKVKAEFYEEIAETLFAQNDMLEIALYDAQTRAGDDVLPSPKVRAFLDGCSSLAPDSKIQSKGLEIKKVPTNGRTRSREIDLAIDRYANMPSRDK